MTFVLKWTAQQLADMHGYGEATRIIEKAELEFIKRELAREVMAEIKRYGKLGLLEEITGAEPVALLEHGELIKWEVSGECEDCEGDGYLYTISGMRAHECVVCDGSGGAEDTEFFITDRDGCLIGPQACNDAETLAMWPKAA